MTYRHAVLARDPTCVYCGRAWQPTVDHLVPRSRGGTLAPGNVVRACGPCNSRRGNVDAIAFAVSVGLNWLALVQRLQELPDLEWRLVQRPHHGLRPGYPLGHRAEVTPTWYDHPLAEGL